jgi:hypothetical protein
MGKYNLQAVSPRQGGEGEDMTNNPICHCRECDEKTCRYCGDTWDGEQYCKECVDKIESERDALRAELLVTNKVCKELDEDRSRLKAELAKSEMGYRGASSDRDRLKAELEKVMDQERHEQARLINERDRLKADMECVVSDQEKIIRRDTAVLNIVAKENSALQVEVVRWRTLAEACREALESISKNGCCAPCREAGLVASQALRPFDAGKGEQRG